MKVLIIHNEYLNHGGEDEVVRTETQMLRDQGVEVISYIRKNEEINNFSLPEKIKYYTKDIFFSQKTYEDIKGLIRTGKPDIAHIHNAFYVVTPAAYQACKEERVPVVQTLHNYRFLCPAATFFRHGQVCEECLDKGRGQAVVHKCFKNSKASSYLLSKVIDRYYDRNVLSDMVGKFIVLSEFSRSKYIQGGFDKNKLEVKANVIMQELGVDELKGDETKESFAVYVGTLQPYKGLNTLINAWKKIGAGFPLKIIGDGPLKEEVQLLTKEVKSIEYLGSKPLAETLEYIKKACFLILPSECYENFPRVIAEAYSKATPVITSDLGAMREIVKDGKTGLLFEPGNAKDLAEKAKMLIMNKNRAAEFGRQGRQEYESKYTAKENFKRLSEIYESVLTVKAN